MYAHNVALAIAPLVLLASADLQLDNDDVPNACRDICQPIVTLTQRCEVDLRGNDDTDRNENRLEAQCVCTNDSFDVASIAALCHDCMRQNIRNNDNNDDDDDNDDNDWDDADLEEMREILYTCGWSTTSYVSASSTAANGITVDATAPTALSQLTTTIVPGSTKTGSASSKTGSGTETAAASATDDASATDSSSDDSASATTDSAAQASETDNAAPALAPFGVAGVVVAGVFAFLV
ncbi:hypothetical protein QQX98_008717 [Neonectria punicea]|uniref:Protein CAP22 n=1 Tax=Neonectria punicea TaxID=979145 RepID=A0ABR1GUL2_9HYPO